MRYSNAILALPKKNDSKSKSSGGGGVLSSNRHGAMFLYFLIKIETPLNKKFRVPNNSSGG
jgi:hypothetical protein